MGSTGSLKKILEDVFAFSSKKRVKLYIVGGYLRDLLLRREKQNPDVDFCIERGAINFGRALAKKIRCGFVVLDKEHGCCRLVKKEDGRIVTLDFTDFRGKTLKDDLLHRDFTINALAAALEDFLKNKTSEKVIIDHFLGKKDLKRKTVRIVNKKAFDEDPLRILRAFSLSAIFNFKINPGTLQLIGLKKKKLGEVSFERIRDELFKMLDTLAAYKYLLLLDKLKILKIMMPEIEQMRGVEQGPYHHLDVWKHSLETVRQLEIILKEIGKNQDLSAYLNKEISLGRRRYALLKLGALLHDIGKPKALRHKDGKTIFHGHERLGIEFVRSIARRLKLSNDELESLEKMVFWHLRPGYLADNEELSERAKFRYFRDTGFEAASVLLVSLADQRATRGPLTTKQSRVQHEQVVSGLIKEYFREQKKEKFPRLINGDDLIKEFGLEPSELIGKILSEIEELQAIGKIKSKTEALKIAGTFLASKRKVSPRGHFSD